MGTVLLRVATKSDLPAMKDLFEKSIRNSCSGDYSIAEIEVWVQTRERPERWLSLLEQQYVPLLIMDGTLVAFGSLLKTNYIDFFYVNYLHHGQGLARKLLNELSLKAISMGAASLESDISITAKPFFEKMGFDILNKNENLRKGETLTNYKMRCDLGNNKA
jgi:putative acetyltransferase